MSTQPAFKAYRPAGDVPQPKAQKPPTSPPAFAPSIGPDEAALVRAAQRGDRLCFRALYELTSASAYRLALRVVKRHELAEEVVQEGYCQAWAKLTSFRAESRFKTWLLTIVRNAALDLLRKEKRRKTVSADGLLEVEGNAPPPERPLHEQELRAALDAALDDLPEVTRSAFTLTALEHLSYAEVSEVLNLTLDSVKCRVYRAREHLRTRLRTYRERVS
ncbi:MAG: RNA polymerase sigma factor [Planctomycetota bacterium]|jgi:RNA polymerase sigma-70 factor (ECF subfamily)